MADTKKATPVKLSEDQKKALHGTETYMVKGKEKEVGVSRDVTIEALEGAKHMKAGERFVVGSSMAIHLIELGYAKEVKGK